jgi:hypothetical protein
MTKTPSRLRILLSCAALAGLLAVAPAMAQVPTPGAQSAAPALHDGARDFDFLLHDWKAHVRRLPDRLVGSDKWVTYDGISNHRSILGSPANLEEFEVDGPAGHMKGQTLRLYDPATRQWSIYLLDVDKGTIGLPPVVGGFTGPRGEFYDQEMWKGRAIIVRYLWLDLSPHAARMEQAFSADGGKTWETNWICELSR